MKPTFTSVLLAVSMTLVAQPFRIQDDPQGGFRILYRGETLVSEIATSVCSDAVPLKSKTARVAQPDGGVAYQVWCEEEGFRFRTEIAVNGAGTQVEITFLTEAPAYHAEVKLSKWLRLTLPFAPWEGAAFEGLVGRATAETRRDGVLSAQTPEGRLLSSDWRFLTLRKGDRRLLFDFNPVGPGDFISIYSFGAVKGLWSVQRFGGNLRFIGGSVLPEYGGLTGAKVRIREGGMEDYDDLHALRKFMYTDTLPAQRQFSFGAKVHGKQYTAAGTDAFDAARGHGWMAPRGLRATASTSPGALYSSVQGTDGTFRIAGLKPGVWLVTLGVGNQDGQDGAFALTCGGRRLGDIPLKAGQATVATVPVWVDGDRLDLGFAGAFRLSTLSIQRLLAKAEDFSFRRGLWVADGFEPSVLFRNAHYRPAPRFALDIQHLAMPVPGQETAAPRKAAPRLPAAAADRTRKGLEWRYGVRFGNALANSATMAELDSPDAWRAFWRKTLEKQPTALIASGLHSRHTYFRHLERSVEFMRRFAAEAHRRGLKVIDHHDTTLLWNLDAGFRVMAERLPEVNRTLADHLPAAQLCLMNPEFRRKYTEYILELVRAGVDGFMLDEATFYADRCGCQHCRGRFFQDTGWQLPLNETDAFFTNPRHPLRKAFLDWHKAQVGNWWVELRRAIDRVNPAVTLLVYTTHYGYISNYATLGMGADLLETARGADFIGTEIMSRNILRSARAIVPFRKAKNLLKTAYGIPIWGLVQTQPSSWNQYFGWALLAMHQQSAWNIDSLKEDCPVAYARFAARHPEVFAGRSAARVALLFSGRTRDWSPTGGVPGEVFGVAQTLEEMHIPYDIIGEMSLGTDAMKQYDVLIAAGAGCLADAEAKAMLDFARQGGTLLLASSTGLYDEYGDPRPAWPFAEALGAAPRPTSTVKLRQIRFRDEEYALERPVVAWPMLASQTKAQVLATHAVGGRDYAALLQRPCGAGRILYTPAYLASQLYAEEGTPGRVWNFQLPREIDRLFRAFLDTAVGKARLWETDAPPTVFTTAYQLDDGYLLHFLNAAASAANAPNKPMPLENPAPAFPPLANDITFTIATPTLSRAVALSNDFMGGRELPAAPVGDGRWRITLPKALLHVHTMVRITK